MKVGDGGDLPKSNASDSFWRVISRSQLLGRLFAVWELLPRARRRDLVMIGRALIQEEKLKRDMVVRAKARTAKR
jgi:hypothetical protein